MIGSVASEAFIGSGTAAAVAVDLGPVDDVPLGQGRAYVIGARTIAVFRQRDGRLFAVDNRCPHRGGPLAEGVIGNGTVICPLHGWKIDLASGHCLSESGGVRAYGAHEVGGRLVVVVSASAQT